MDQIVGIVKKIAENTTKLEKLNDLNVKEVFGEGPKGQARKQIDRQVHVQVAPQVSFGPQKKRQFSSILSSNLHFDVLAVVPNNNFVFDSESEEALGHVEEHYKVQNNVPGPSLDFVFAKCESDSHQRNFKVRIARHT